MGDEDDDDAGDIMGEDDVGDGGNILRRGKSFGSDRVTVGVCAAAADGDAGTSSPAPMILSKACCRFLGTIMLCFSLPLLLLLLLLLLLMLSRSSLSIAWRIR